MAKSTNINNRRYLGNKYKLLPFIKKVVDSECTDIEIVVDIFGDWCSCLSFSGQAVDN